MVSILHVLHIALLHLLWYDGCGSDTKSPCCFYCGCCILCNLESLFRICRPETCKYLYRVHCERLFQWMYVICILTVFSCLLITEHSNMVEMVLLGMSSCMDHLWIGCISIWRYNYCYVDRRRKRCKDFP